MKRHYTATDATWVDLIASLKLYEHYVRDIAENPSRADESDYFIDEAERITALKNLIERDDVSISFTLSGGPPPDQDLAVSLEPRMEPESPQKLWDASQAAAQASLGQSQPPTPGHC